MKKVANWDINSSNVKKLGCRQAKIIARTPAKTKQRQARDAREVASQKQYKTTSKRRKQAEQDDMSYIGGKKAALLAAKIKK